MVISVIWSYPWKPSKWLKVRKHNAIGSAMLNWTQLILVRTEGKKSNLVQLFIWQQLLIKFNVSYHFSFSFRNTDKYVVNNQNKVLMKSRLHSGLFWFCPGGIAINHGMGVIKPGTAERVRIAGLESPNPERLKSGRQKINSQIHPTWEWTELLNPEEKVLS